MLSAEAFRLRLQIRVTAATLAPSLADAHRDAFALDPIPWDRLTPGTRRAYVDLATRLLLAMDQPPAREAPIADALFRVTDCLAHYHDHNQKERVR